MVFFLTGVPGSGKSYYLVNYAEQNLQKVDKKTNEKQYLQVVHNISGYKHGFYTDFGSEYLPKILQLNNYFLQVKKDNNKDELLIEYAEKIGIYKILLIVDEAHLYFVNDFSVKGKKQYYALLWFISYHRHLYIDIVLASQNLSLVDYKFKGFAEFFVKAVPASLRFNLNPFGSDMYTYNYFPDSKMWNDTKFKTEKIVAEKKIFDLYTSGDSVKKQKVYLQTLIIIAVLLMLVVGMWFLFKRTFTHHPGVNKPIENEKKVNTPAPAIQNDLKSNLSPSEQKRIDKRENDIRKFTNDDLLFDVVDCSDLSGDCSTTHSQNRIHYQLFKKMIDLQLIEVMSISSQYGISKYFITVNISKDSYLGKFLIGVQNFKKDDHKDMIDFEEIKDQYKSQS